MGQPNQPANRWQGQQSSAAPDQQRQPPSETGQPIPDLHWRSFTGAMAALETFTRLMLEYGLETGSRDWPARAKNVVMGLAGISHPTLAEGEQPPWQQRDAVVSRLGTMSRSMPLLIEANELVRDLTGRQLPSAAAMVDESNSLKWNDNRTHTRIAPMSTREEMSGRASLAAERTILESDAQTRPNLAAQIPAIMANAAREIAPIIADSIADRTSQGAAPPPPPSTGQPGSGPGRGPADRGGNRDHPWLSRSVANAFFSEETRQAAAGTSVRGATSRTQTSDNRSQVQDPDRGSRPPSPRPPQGHTPGG